MITDILYEESSFALLGTIYLGKIIVAAHFQGAY